MPWDEISKADYKPWTSSISNDAVVRLTYDQIGQNTTFSKIKSSITWLEKYNDKEYSLNIIKYKDEQKKLKDTYKELDELYKLSNELNIKNIIADTTAISRAKEKVERNKAWLKKISNDIYIDENVKVINNMIGQSGTAKRN